MKMKYYWIEEVDGKYIVTDGIWTSREYDTKAEAQKHLELALWGEGVNTI